MSIEKLKEKLTNYSNALNRLEESLKRDESDDIVIDAAIRRFAITYELSWKVLKVYLSYNDIVDIKTPREAFKEAFAAGIVDEGDVWIEMINDRTLTSQIYEEVEARVIYERVKNKYFQILFNLKRTISSDIQS